MFRRILRCAGGADGTTRMRCCCPGAACRWFQCWIRRVGSVFVGVGSIGWRRQFRYDRNSFVSLKMTSLKINEVPQEGILIRNDEQDFVFGATIKSPVKEYIASLISQEAAEV